MERSRVLKSVFELTILGKSSLALSKGPISEEKLERIRTIPPKLSSPLLV
jgi:hypothetical protein